MEIRAKKSLTTTMPFIKIEANDSYEGGDDEGKNK